MRKPDIAKRMLPLLDIIMLLLSFFIVLPHGIVTNEKVQIENLTTRNQDLKQQLDYQKWMYGNRAELAGNDYKTATIQLTGDQLFIGGERIPELSWEKYLLDRREIEKVSFVLIQVQDMPGPGKTTTKIRTVDRLKKVCQKLGLMYIVESE